MNKFQSKRFALLFLICCVVCGPMYADDTKDDGLNVLIVGSKKGSMNSLSFAPSGIKTQLEKILKGGQHGKVNVVLEDRSKVQKEEAKFEINTWLGRKKTTPGYTKENVYFTLDKKDIRNFNVFIEYPGPLKAPVNKDDEIAYIKIYNKDELIRSVPIYAAEKVKKLNFLLSLFMSFNYMIWGDA